MHTWGGCFIYSTPNQRLEMWLLISLTQLSGVCKEVCVQECFWGGWWLVVNSQGWDVRCFLTTCDWVWSRQQPTGRRGAFDSHLIFALSLINMEEGKRKNAALCLFISCSPCFLSFNDQNVMKHVLAVYLGAHCAAYAHKISAAYRVSELSLQRYISRRH